MSERSNQEWLEELRGDHGHTRQAQAHQDLAAYLYTVAYNYLLTRQAKVNPQILVSFAPQELATLAKDFVQETLEKLARNDFTLLDQFKGKGDFTSWVAVIVRRQVAQELRKSYWERRVSLSQDVATQNEHDKSWSGFELIAERAHLIPENAVIQQQVGEVLLACLAELKDSHRRAFLGLVVEGRSGEELAQVLNRPSSNAVFVLVARAKRQIRKCLQKKGWNQDVLEIFTQSRSESQAKVK